MNRKQWTYRGCRIEPVVGESKYFGSPTFVPDARCVQYRTRWWRIHFPDETWCDCGTKFECVDYVGRQEKRLAV